MDAEDLSAYRAMTPDLKRHVEEGRKPAAKLWESKLRAFREEREAWLAPYKLAGYR